MDENARKKQRYAQDPDFRTKVIARNSRWNRANKDKLNALERERYAADPAYRASRRVRDWLKSWRRRGYDGSILQEYERKFKEQGGVCAMCKQKSDRRLCLDHCHLTQLLRSLLCDSCNMGLGNLRENPDLLRTGADYVEYWRAIHRTQGGFGPNLPIRERAPQGGRHSAVLSPRVANGARAQRERLSAFAVSRIPLPRPAGNAMPQRSKHGWTSPLV